MQLSLDIHLIYTASEPCDVLLQIEPLSDAVQRCDGTLTFDPEAAQMEITGDEGLGVRRWIQAGARFECRYAAQVDLTRTQPEMARLVDTPRVQLPGEVIKFLMPSRFCHSEQFQDFVYVQFGHLTGGALVQGVSDWIGAHFCYDPEASFASTSASDSFAALAGVCRDYAHVLIAVVRAAGIPARFVSAYAPDVTPQDFHAVAEVYLDGAWHLIDPTGMSSADEVVRIGVGRDAADVAFFTSFGFMQLEAQQVQVARIPES